MKTVMVGLLVLLMAMPALAAEKFSLRGVSIGMSVEQVMTIEKDLELDEEPYRDEEEGIAITRLNYVLPKTDLIKEGYVSYGFANDKLLYIVVTLSSVPGEAAGELFYAMYQDTLARNETLLGKSQPNNRWLENRVQVPSDFDRSDIKTGLLKGYVSIRNNWGDNDDNPDFYHLSLMPAFLVFKEDGYAIIEEYGFLSEVPEFLELAK